VLPPVDAKRLREIFGSEPIDADDTGPATKHGLITVGSHVALTTRQLDRLRVRARSSNWSWTFERCSTTPLASDTSTRSPDKQPSCCATTKPTATS
jgi:hypothetical protein